MRCCRRRCFCRQRFVGRGSRTHATAESRECQRFSTRLRCDWPRHTVPKSCRAERGSTVPIAVLLHNERGAALVELAICLALLALISLGITDVARSYVLTTQARSAASE